MLRATLPSPEHCLSKSTRFVELRISSFLFYKTLAIEVFLRDLVFIAHPSHLDLIMVCLRGHTRIVAIAVVVLARAAAFVPYVSFTSRARLPSRWPYQSRSPALWQQGREVQKRGRYVTSGVASLRSEVLPEGGVSPCVIKVRARTSPFFNFPFYPV